MSAPFVAAVAFLAGAALLGLTALALGRLLGPPRVAPDPAPSGLDSEVAGTGVHSWHLVALGSLFQAVLVPLLVWGAAYGDRVRQGWAAVAGLLAFLALAAVGLVLAWREGLLDTGAPRTGEGGDDDLDV